MDVVDLIKLGEDYLVQEDTSNARSKFLDAIVLAPEDPQLHNRLGMLEMSQGNFKQAQKYYTKACALAPDVSRYHMRLGDSLQRLGKYEDSIQSYARSLELEPKNAPAWNNRGFANFNINRWNEALRCYDESMSADPSYAVAWYNYGYTLQLSGRLNESKDYYQKAVELDPEDKIAWNNLANVHYNQGQYERSIEIYKKSLDLDPNYVIAVNNIGNALDHLHRYEESIPYHEKAIELDNKFHYAWMAKGRALTRLNRAEEGLEFIETSIELDDDDDPDYHEALCRCYIKLNLLNKARQIVNLGLSIDGQHVPCWIALGDVNFELNNLEQALQCYDEAVQAQDILSRNRMRDLDWIEKGKILEKAGVIHEGIRQYTNAVNVASETSRPYFKKANILIEYDRLDEARDIVSKGLTLDPESITGSKLLLQVMSAEEVIESLDKYSKFKTNQEISYLIAHKLVDKSPELALTFLSEDKSQTLYLKIQCLKLLKRNDEALIKSKKLIDFNPDKIEGWISAGWCSYELENYKDANDYFESALGCDISNPDALVGKALVLKAQSKDYSYYNQALKDIDSNLVI